MIHEEGSIKISVDEGIVSKKLPVFFNKVMKDNRDISIELLKVLKRESIALPLAGTGIRGLRMLKELPDIKEIYFNDISPEAIKRINYNLKLNKLNNSSKVKIFQRDANLFLLDNPFFDYIDVDPFGSPCPFLDCAIKKLRNNGILAVTATDTGALCGSFKEACKRKYWSISKKDGMMHETAIRIFIRRIQLSGFVYDKALTPILSYSKDHYVRAFFICKFGKKRCDTIVEKHQMFNNCGPLWVGNIQDKDIIKKIDNEFVKKLVKEIDCLGLYHIHFIAKELKCKVPNFEKLIKIIKDRGYEASRTHFTQYGIKSDIPRDELYEIMLS